MISKARLSPFENLLFSYKKLNVNFEIIKKRLGKLTLAEKVFNN